MIHDGNVFNRVNDICDGLKAKIERKIKPLTWTYHSDREEFFISYDGRLLRVIKYKNLLSETAVEREINSLYQDFLDR
jgi:hypothetical protein